MSEHLPWLNDQLACLNEEGLIRRKRSVVPVGEGWCVADGKKLRNFATNDYLGLAEDPQVIEAARTALDSTGIGARASALVTGRTEWHVRLEEKLAEFEGTESAIVFPTGYSANVGTISALVTAEDIVFCDRLNHASLVDGCKLSGAKLRVYRHDQLEHLEKELMKASGFQRRFLVTDGLFSMDGDLAPLPELCDLAERYDVAVVVDEAHGTGVFGEKGRGSSEYLDIEDRVAVRIGTLSKAIGALGGFVAGPQHLVDWLWNRARTGVFSTALPPSVCAAACAALEIIGSEPGRRVDLLERSARFREQLADNGIESIPNSVGPIVPIVLNDADRAVAVAEKLEDHGFLVAAIRPPTVPRGTSRLRITLSHVQNEETMNDLIEALSRVLTEETGS